MFEGIKYRTNLNRLYRKRKKIASIYKVKLDKAEKENMDEEDLWELSADAGFEDSMILEEISLLITEKLEEARKLVLAIPDLSNEKMPFKIL